MANRYFTQFFYSFFKKPILIAGKIPLSAAAAVGTVAIKGVASVVKSGTGLYTVTLEDKYFELVSIGASVADSAEDLAIDFASIDLTAKTFVIQTKVAGVIDDVSDACDVYINLVLNDSSV
jgi:hypothetical protein